MTQEESWNGVIKMNENVYLEGKIIGEICDGIYVSHRETKKHFYIKRRGYPISDSVLQYLKSKNVSRIRIVEKGKSIKVFQCLLEKYLNAELFKEGEFDSQRCVPLCEMQQVN
jgi:hypothetical protein